VGSAAQLHHRGCNERHVVPTVPVSHSTWQFMLSAPLSIHAFLFSLSVLRAVQCEVLQKICSPWGPAATGRMDVPHLIINLANTGRSWNYFLFSGFAGLFLFFSLTMLLASLTFLVLLVLPC